MIQDSLSNNIEIVRQIYNAFANRDISAVFSFLDPQVIWCEPNNPYNPSSGTRHGHEGFLEWLKVGQESEEILILEPRQFLTNENSVAVIGYTKCRAKSTAKEYDTDFVHLITLKDGKVEKFQEFFDTYAAAEAFRY